MVMRHRHRLNGAQSGQSGLPANMRFRNQVIKTLMQRISQLCLVLLAVLRLSCNDMCNTTGSV